MNKLGNIVCLLYVVYSNRCFEIARYNTTALKSVGTMCVQPLPTDPDCTPTGLVKTCLGFDREQAVDMRDINR